MLNKNECKKSELIFDDKNTLEDSALVNIKEFIDFFPLWLKEGTACIWNKIVEIVDSEEKMDEINIAKEMGKEFSTIVKIVSVVYKVASIPDQLFMNKVEKYCKGLVEIPLSKRQAYIEKVGRKSLNEESVFILNVLNKVEELSKIDIFIKLFEAKINDQIDDSTYRRMMLQVNRTMLSDIIYMGNNIIDNDVIKITSVEEEGLLTSGWIVFAGIGIGSSSGNGGNLYEYTKLAKNFCNIVFHKNLLIGESSVPILSVTVVEK